MSLQRRELGSGANLHLRKRMNMNTARFTRLTQLYFADCYQGLPEETNKLRCPPTILPIDHSQYRPPRQEELEHPPPKWYTFVQILCPRSSTDRSSPGIVSAPLWDSHTSTFAGLLTTSDYINVVQYYWQNPDALNQIDQFRLSSLRGRTAFLLTLCKH